MDEGKKFPFVLVAFAGIALAGLATRLLTVPWDSGGCFFQVWVSAVTLAFLAAGLPRMKRPQRLLAGGILLPLGGFVVFGSVYFAPQALFPFLFVGIACAGALWMGSHGKRIPAILLGLLLLPLCAYGVYGIRHMMLLSRLRGLQGNEVRELRFTSLADDGKTIAVRESTVVNEIVESLGDTRPYSPNHEGITEPWRLRIDLTDGTPISFSVGKGNRAHPHTAWIQFDSEVYQNPSLYRTLEEQGIGLWSNGELGRAQEEMPNKPDGGDG